jgi:hypothetical protein
MLSEFAATASSTATPWWQTVLVAAGGAVAGGMFSLGGLAISDRNARRGETDRAQREGVSERSREGRMRSRFSRRCRHVPERGSRRLGDDQAVDTGACRLGSPSRDHRQLSSRMQSSGRHDSRHADAWCMSEEELRTNLTEAFST